MKKKISLVSAIALIVAFSSLSGVTTAFFTVKSLMGDFDEKYKNLRSLDTYVRQNFYGDIDEKTLSDGILKGYVAGLDDKYSRYLSSDDYEEEKTENSGEMKGIGITVEKDESGYIKIVEIMPDSPASEAGLQTDDIILTINGEDTAEKGFEQSVSSMSETEEVKITLKRGKIEKKYTLARRLIEVQSVTGKMLDEKTGYIKISGFRENTTEQFKEVLDRVTAEGAKGIIFDVRENGGGLLDALEKCLDPLLPEGEIATAEYCNGKTETIVYSDEKELNLPMVVLVNGNTASAAELFSASLRDFAKAELIGTQTYGKGVMQTTSELSNGGAVVLTIAEYKTAESECYDGVGLTPDYKVENSTDGTDKQLEKAIEVINKKIK